MTDYNDIITRLRSMDGIGDIQLNELMNRKTPMVAADAIAELASRVSMLESARIAYASEFSPDGEGLPDVGSIHQNIRALKTRVSELESRLEVTSEHDIDGIAARDATIKLQDGRIAELEANRADLAKQALVAWDSGEEWEPLALCLCAEENGLDSCHELIWEGYPPEPWGERWQKYEREAKRMIDLVSQYAALPVAASVRLTDAELEADRNTWRDKYMTQAGQLDLLKEAATFLASERAEREKQEPVAWYIDGEDGREYNGAPKMSGGRIGTPLYAAPPVITQHEPVTTVEDRYNADGWINPNDKTQKQHLPHIGEKVLFCHAGVTYYGKHTGGSFQSFNPPRMFETWGCLWMYPPKAREVRS